MPFGRQEDISLPKKKTVRRKGFQVPEIQSRIEIEGTELLPFGGNLRKHLHDFPDVYTPKNQHGTWKLWFPIGISFSKGPFSGSMFVLGSVNAKREYYLRQEESRVFASGSILIGVIAFFGSCDTKPLRFVRFFPGSSQNNYPILEKQLNEILFPP